MGRLGGGGLAGGGGEGCRFVFFEKTSSNQERGREPEMRVLVERAFFLVCIMFFFRCLYLPPPLDVPLGAAEQERLEQRRERRHLPRLAQLAEFGQERRL